MSAVNAIDQVREVIMRDCLLVMFENLPSRLVPEDADVLRGLNSCCKDRREYERTSWNDPPSPFYGVADEWLRDGKSLNA